MGETFEHVVQTHMRGFFRSGVMGCHFAAAHATASSEALMFAVHLRPLDEELTGDVESFFDSAGESNAAAVMVFPVLRSALDIAALLGLLHGRERWQLSREPWTKHPRRDVLIGVRWRTAAGATTSVMGMAPLGSMPPTRRAPYVALVAWTGGYANEHRPMRTAGEVGLVDMPVPTMDAEAYRSTFTATLEKGKALKAALCEGAAEPNVAFCLPEELEAKLAHLWQPA